MYQTTVRNFEGIVLFSQITDLPISYTEEQKILKSFNDRLFVDVCRLPEDYSSDSFNCQGDVFGDFLNITDHVKGVICPK